MVKRRPTILVFQLLAAPAVAVVVLAGVWVAGGLITDSFTGSAVATALWFAVAGIACLALAVRHAAVRWPLLLGYGVTVAAVSVYLGYSMFNDRVVDERVVVAVPAAPAESDRGRSQAPAPEQRNVQQAAGRFRSGEHTTSGRATVVRMPDGRRFLTLTRFETDAGPDLRVRLVPGGGTDGAAEGAIDLGALRGNRGDQQYELPRGARVRGSSVVIWCRAFSAEFGTASLA